MVKNFKQSKIYKIESIYSNDDEPIYIGSTTKAYLSQRMTAHRSGYKRYNKTGLGFMSSYLMFDKYGIDKCKISLLENVDANNSDELKTYEAKYIKLLNCVNINYNQIIKKQLNIKKNNKDKFINCIQLFYKNDISHINIKLLNELETEANISRFQVGHKEIDEPIIISDELYKRINTVFRSVEKKPLMYNKFIVYYVAKLNNMIGKLNIIDKSNDQINYNRMTRYKINEPLLFNYIKDALTIDNKDNFDMNIINNFNILKPLFL